MALTKAQLIDLNANEMIIDLDGDTSINIPIKNVLFRVKLNVLYHLNFLR